MDWSAIPDDPSRNALAEALVPITATQGWTRAALAQASVAALPGPDSWRDLFPRGAVDAIWHISKVSDASMLAAFRHCPATSLVAVVDERFAQNRDLKPFVRRVMDFDVLHPLQALRRMQRTARAMYQCLGQSRPGPSFATLTLLNLLYTMVVFIWLFDRSPDDRITRGATRRLMALVLRPAPGSAE
ncbi:MAG: hypothetical protein Q7U20_08700 [Caulobacter sp.]|nr:hypothetical protein [Caulobacter sp.]